MATWSIATATSWTGKIITATEWNSYFGSAGSVAYLKETFGRYYTSFFVTKSVTLNTVTSMFSYTIPANWKAGVYTADFNTYITGTTEAAVDARRQIYIYVNNVNVRQHNYLTVASSFTLKPIYTVSICTELNPNDIVDFRFWTQTTASYTSYGALQKVST